MFLPPLLHKCISAQVTILRLSVVNKRKLATNALVHLCAGDKRILSLSHFWASRALARGRTVAVSGIGSAMTKRIGWR